MDVYNLCTISNISCKYTQVTCMIIAWNTFDLIDCYIFFSNNGSCKFTIYPLWQGKKPIGSIDKKICGGLSESVKKKICDKNLFSFLQTKLNEVLKICEKWYLLT